MCDTCGCSQPADAVTFQKPGEHHHHGHGHHDHDHAHHHHPGDSRTLQVEVDVLSKNNLIAERNRGYFDAKSILALNLVSSPGSGKTTLLEKTISHLKTKYPMSVIEGDQQTLRDAERIQSTGAPVIQVNTGKGCHLDADMIHKAIHDLSLEENSILWIENVGNLVCPALFDLGEAMKVAIISVTEGDDKPLKYPNMFRESQICIINKTDLIPYVDFSLESCRDAARQVNPSIEFFELSATTEEGLDSWLDWIHHQMEPKK